MIKVLVPKFQLDGSTWYRAKQSLMMAHENEQIQLMEFDPNVLTTEQVFKAVFKARLKAVAKATKTPYYCKKYSTCYT